MSVAPQLYTSLIVHVYSATYCPEGVMCDLFKQNNKKQLTVYQIPAGLLNSTQYAQGNLGGVCFSETTNSISFQTSTKTCQMLYFTGQYLCITI